MSRGLPLKRWQLFDYIPNAWALENIHTRDERFITAVTARQVGKTLTGGIEIDTAMTEPPDEFGRPPSVGVLAPTYEKAELLVKEYEDRIRRAFDENYYQRNSNKHWVRLPHNEAELRWLSGTDPQSVIGYTFSTLITDESQKISDEVWNKIYPTLSVRKARVISFGTPDITPDQSWYRANFVRGGDPLYADHHSFSVTAFESPWIADDEIKRAQDEMTEREFRMLYLAEWPDEEGIVFRGWRSAMMPTPPVFDPTRRHIMSVDFGLIDDFTVVMLGESSTRTVIKMERFREGASIPTYDKIQDMWEAWGHPKIYADGQGYGKPMCEELRARGMRVVDAKFTVANKMPNVLRLAADMEHRRIQFPGWQELTSELDAYVFQTTPSGKITANAAAGYHDDCVTSLIMLNVGFHTSRGGVHRPRNYLTEDALPLHARTVRIHL